MKHQMDAMTGPSFGLSFETAGADGGGNGASAPTGGEGDGAGAAGASGGASGEAGGGQPGGGSAAAAGGGADGAGAAGAGGQPPKAEDLFEIVVNGKQEKVSRADLIAYAQQGKSYTTKSQALADERRRWEADRETVLRAEKDRWAREQAEAAERQRQESETDPGQRALSQSQRLEQRFEDQALDISLGRLLPKFPSISEREFIMEASARGITTADGVAKHGEAILNEMMKSRDEGFNSRFSEILKKGDHPELKSLIEAKIAEYLQKKTAGGAPPNNGNASTPSLGGAPRKARTFDEAADIADEMLRAGAAR